MRSSETGTGCVALLKEKLSSIIHAPLSLLLLMFHGSTEVRAHTCFQIVQTKDTEHRRHNPFNQETKKLFLRRTMVSPQKAGKAPARTRARVRRCSAAPRAPLFLVSTYPRASPVDPKQKQQRGSSWGTTARRTLAPSHHAGLPARSASSGIPF